MKETIDIGSFSSAVNLYSFHSHAAKNSRESNASHEKQLLATLVPSIASFWLLISLSAYLWLKKRAEKGRTRHSNLYLIYYSAFLVGEVHILIHEWKNNQVMRSR